MSAYDVEATLVGSAWHISVPAIDRVTQARHTREIEEMASDLIEIMTGDKSPELNIRFILPDETNSHLREAAKLREAEANARRAAAIEVRIAAKLMKDQGLALRDIGAVLGVSHQRVAQLIEKGPVDIGVTLVEKVPQKRNAAEPQRVKASHRSKRNPPG